MMTTQPSTIDNVVCPCNTGWNSILPAPPCHIHAQTYNGLCYCRGAFDPHPFHTGSPAITFTTTAKLTLHPASPHDCKHCKAGGQS